MFKHPMFSALAYVLMTAQTAEGGEGAASTERETAKIRPNLEGYKTAKSASGSSTKICGDDVSTALLGATLDEAYGFVAKVVGVEESELRAKYGARNLGQQRMFLGNLIRGGMASKDAEKAGRIAAAFADATPGFRTVIDARVEADNEAKAKAAEEKKAAAEAKKAKAAEEKKAAAEAKKAAAAEAKAAKVVAPKEPAQAQ